MKPNRSKKIPVTILTGFLGSGKTTLLNHILNSPDHKLRFAIIENEFGDIGVDDKVLSENVDEEIIEVMNGCICCTVRGDLVEALKRLYKKVASFDGVIIETTGLADPAPVVQTFFVDTEIQTMYSLDSVITVVDAKHIVPRLEEVKPDGVENEAVEQIAFADIVILNKIDLVPDESNLSKIEMAIKAINPQTTITRAQHGKVEAKLLINMHAFDLTRVLDFDPEFLDDNQEHQHDQTVVSSSAKFEGELNLDLLQAWISRLLEDLGADLYRYKGVMAVKGMDKKFVFQGVGMLFAGNFEGCWKKNEVRECRFVFIGKNLDKEILQAGFHACKVSETLRFKIGEIVEANVGEYTKGKVMKHWDEGNAYRIQLLDAKGTNVWAPIDIDAYIRMPRKQRQRT